MKRVKSQFVNGAECSSFENLCLFGWMSLINRYEKVGGGGGYLKTTV